MESKMGLARVLATVFCSIAMLAGSPARSALIDQGPTTRDSISGLEWLDITSTAGMSYSAVLASSFVTAEGFRFATEAEVRQLFVSAGGNGSSDGTILASNTAPVQQLLQLLGCTSYLAGNACDGRPEDWSLAMWGGSSGVYVGVIDNLASGGALWARYFQLPDPNVAFRADVGAFLVREAQNVPEPGTSLLAMLGLVAAVRSRRLRLA